MSEKPSSENWTRDANGQPVDWTKAPYSKDNGIVRLLLDGEDMDDVRRSEYKKRVNEYYAIIKKRHAAKLAKRAADGEYVPRPGGGVMRRSEQSEPEK